MTRSAKHIGILAVSAEGAALCYRTICTEGAEFLGPHAHPEVTMHTYDAVVLGCTEIPLLLSQADSPLPVLDSTRILARAALREATRDM